MIEAVVERCAGIDVGRKFVMVCVMVGEAREGRGPARHPEFYRIDKDLEQLAAQRRYERRKPKIQHKARISSGRLLDGSPDRPGLEHEPALSEGSESGPDARSGATACPTSLAPAATLQKWLREPGR